MGVGGGVVVVVRLVIAERLGLNVCSVDDEGTRLGKRAVDEGGAADVVVVEEVRRRPPKRPANPVNSPSISGSNSSSFENCSSS